jgi:uncharacterized RmlC-like cupin family protein
MASVIRPTAYDSDTLYEPPLTIGFGIDGGTVANPPAAMGKTVIPPGAKNQSHHHTETDACIHIISGRVRFRFGDPGGPLVEEVAQGGDFVHIPRGEGHGVENVSDTEPVHLVFCYPGVPDSDAAGTVMLEDESVIRKGRAIE